MKRTITLVCFALFSIAAWSQTYFGLSYLHETNSFNAQSNYTLLDPALIGGDNSDLLICQHIYGTPAGTCQSYFTHSYGLWWEGSTWSIFDEQTSFLMPEDIGFNVLNPSTHGTVFTHTVTVGNSFSNYSLIENPLLNGNPDAVFFISKTWENGAYDIAHTGIWYDEFYGRWSVYNEDGGTSLTLNSTYNVFVPDAGTTCFKHVATSTSYITEIDHPLLNNNPFARIFCVHDYTNDPGSIGYVNNEAGVWYDEFAGKWTLYTEEISPLFIGATFNVLIADPFNVGVEEKDASALFNVYPNPAVDKVNLTLNKMDWDEVQRISVRTADGRMVIMRNIAGQQPGTLDVSGLPSGLYFVTLETSKGLMTSKINIIR